MSYARIESVWMNDSVVEYDVSKIRLCFVRYVECVLFSSDWVWPGFGSGSGFDSIGPLMMRWFCDDVLVWRNIGQHSDESIQVVQA